MIIKNKQNLLKQNKIFVKFSHFTNSIISEIFNKSKPLGNMINIINKTKTTIYNFQKNNFCIYPGNKDVSQKKFSFAIVGSGPGGFYSAKQILKKYPNFHIDIYEKLPHPFGLIRTGIAPDHQEAKNVEKDFSELIKKSNFIGVNFFGNVDIGKNITFEDLHLNYSGIIFSYGAGEENKLNIKNEDSFGCFSARNFVNWYNGHIDYAERSDFMNENFDLGKIKDVVIIGNGNVAIDIARLLSKNYNDIKKFDIPEKILEKFSKNKIKNIHIVARRGLVQSAFTVKELRELSKLPDCKIYVLREEIKNSMNENSEKEMDANNPSERRHFSRKLELINTLNIIDSEEQLEEIRKNGDGKQIFLRFLLTPLDIIVEENQMNNFKSVSGIRFLRSHLEGTPNQQNAVIDRDSKKSEYFFETNLIFKSIGYKSTNIFPKFINFDFKNNIISNKWGVVFDPKNNLYDDVFTCGWVKRGAKGIVDSTLRDSYDTFNSINYLLESEKLKPKIPDIKGIIQKIEKGNVKIVNNEKWNIIDRIELEKGVKLGKIREKIINYDEMMKIIY